MPRSPFKLFKAPAAKIPLTLTDRHYLILHTVGTYKFITSQLTAALLIENVHDPVVRGNKTGEVLKRAMTDLFRHGYLARPPVQVLFRQMTQGSHELIYTLTPKGRAALTDKYPNLSQTLIDPSRDVQIPAMLHTLMIARYRVTLTKALHQTQPQLQLKAWQQGKHLKSLVTVQGRRTPVIPDAFFTITNLARPTGANTAPFFLEADRSTMSLTRFKRKLQAYAIYKATGSHTTQHGIQGFRVLTITPSKERRDNLRQLAATLPLAGAFWFAHEQDFDPWHPETILQPIWVTGKHPEPRELLPP